MKLAHSILACAAAAVCMASTAQAADMLQPADPIYSSPLFNFEGLYVGATGGGSISSGSPYGNLGVVVGANFAVSNGIIAGVEFQGDTYWDAGGYAAYDALALGRIGGFVSDNTMIYGDIGGGSLNGSAAYAFGGGIEMAVTDMMSVRGDIQGIGVWGSTPSVGKATVGLLFHIQ